MCESTTKWCREDKEKAESTQARNHCPSVLEEIDVMASRVIEHAGSIVQGAPLTGPNLLPGTEYGKIYVWVVPYNPKTANILCSRSLALHQPREKEDQEGGDAHRIRGSSRHGR